MHLATPTPPSTPPPAAPPTWCGLSMQPSVMQLLKGLYHLHCVPYVLLLHGFCHSWLPLLLLPASSSSSCLEQVTLATPTGAGAVHMTIVTTQALQVLVASAAMMRMRMIMRVRVAGEIVRAVRVAATVAHLDRGINKELWLVSSLFYSSLCSCSSRLSSRLCYGSSAV